MGALDPRPSPAPGAARARRSSLRQKALLLAAIASVPLLIALGGAVWFLQSVKAQTALLTAGETEVERWGARLAVQALQCRHFEHGYVRDLLELLSACELGDEIPVEVWTAVAELLAWLWSLRGEPAP
jgi:hypothetical protein